MRKGDLTRQTMIEAATRLFEAQGYAATGVKQIIEESGTPRGSMYFHFPDGKEGIALAVIERHATWFGEVLKASLAQGPVLEAARQFIETVAAQIEVSACASGCPVGALALEMGARSDRIRNATRAAFDGWTQTVSARLVAEGCTPKEAGIRARGLVSAFEGAVVLSRAYGGRAPFDDFIALLPRLLGD